MHCTLTETKNTLTSLDDTVEYIKQPQENIKYYILSITPLTVWRKIQILRQIYVNGNVALSIYMQYSMFQVCLISSRGDFGFVWRWDRMWVSGCVERISFTGLRQKQFLRLFVLDLLLLYHCLQWKGYSWLGSPVLASPPRLSASSPGPCSFLTALSCWGSVNVTKQLSRETRLFQFTEKEESLGGRRRLQSRER